MAYLYAQPKDDLQREIAELKRESWDERKEHMKTKQLLRVARAKIDALESRIEGMKQYLQAAIAEADHDIGPAVVERYRKSLQMEFDDAASDEAAPLPLTPIGRYITAPSNRTRAS
jgi:predicted  nucleic acid-binding Zn-ribbon protein